MNAWQMNLTGGGGGIQQGACWRYVDTRFWLFFFFFRNNDADTSFGIFGHVNMSTVIDIGSHVGVGSDGIGVDAAA